MNSEKILNQQKSIEVAENLLKEAENFVLFVETKDKKRHILGQSTTEFELESISYMITYFLKNIEPKCNTSSLNTIKQTILAGVIFTIKGEENITTEECIKISEEIFEKYLA